jgi:NO-binding membrane sensor protein with MHYT domain
MRTEAIEAWTQLYAAVGLLAAICAGCAALKTVLELRSGAVVVPHATWKHKLLLVPRLWLRFQFAYMSGFPCIMGIALLYAHYIGFAAFNPS